jgi:molybdate transport system permease protein
VLSAHALDALLVSLKVASCATALVLVPGVLAGWLLARRDFPLKGIAETAVSLPLVLPPTAVGYILLNLFAVSGPLGSGRLGFDLDLLFTWKGAVAASSIMSLPLVARTARIAFEGVDPRLEGMARTLGLAPWATFARVTVPLARRGLLASAVLGFSRALGEFGATVIVAGNIPGRTQTLALAIFSDIQAGRGEDARSLLLLTTILAFGGIYLTERLLRRGDAPGAGVAKAGETS